MGHNSFDITEFQLAIPFLYYVIAFGHSVIILGHSVIAFLYYVIAFGHSVIIFGRSVIAFGHSVIAFGHSIIAFGHSVITFLYYGLAFGHSVIEWNVWVCLTRYFNEICGLQSQQYILMVVIHNTTTRQHSRDTKKSRPPHMYTNKCVNTFMTRMDLWCMAYYNMVESQGGNDFSNSFLLKFLNLLVSAASGTRFLWNLYPSWDFEAKK